MSAPDAATANYLALADALEAAIVNLDPGTKLASEHELCALHSVSRVTARSALQELERRHLVRRTRGSGTYVALRLPYPLRTGTSPSWSHIVRSEGHVPTYRVDAITQIPAEPWIARSLLVPLDSPVVRIVRVGFVDGEPGTHQTMHFPTETFGRPADVEAELATGLAEQPSTTTLLAERFGVELERHATRVELRPIDLYHAQLLDLSGRPMAWRTETVNRCRRTDKAVEHTIAWLRADSFAVFMEVGPVDGPSPFAPPRSSGPAETDRKEPLWP